MSRYLIVYGADSELATFMADDAEHAVEQFCVWAPVSPDYQTNRDSITEIMICTPVKWEA